jgi:hypothetical protein
MLNRSINKTLKKNRVFLINVEKTLDPWVKPTVGWTEPPEDDNLNCWFLFVIPAGLRRESSQNYGHFNFFMNEPTNIFCHSRLSGIFSELAEEGYRASRYDRH